MRGINRKLAITIVALSVTGIMISMGVIYSYATVTSGYTVENTVVENTVTENVAMPNYQEKNKESSNNNNNKKTKKNQTVKQTTKIEYSKTWEEEFNNKIAKLQQKYPKGYYWNHAGNGKNLGVTTTPCDHKNGKCYCNVYDSKSTKACGFKVGRQCAGFASLLSDEVFGKDAPVRIFYNYDEIRVGDQARINNNSHTVFIIEKTDDYVVVAECNADYKTCVINWGRKIPRSGLKGFYITRWQ